MAEKVRTNCHFCGYCCAFLATVEDGHVTALEPDSTRYPYDERILYGCPRWRMNIPVLDSLRRVNHPLRRVGERGSGEWERVTWDDALDDIAARLAALRDEYGPGVLASAIGGPHASFWPLHRFMSLFGSPNNMGIGNICWNPRIWMDTVTFGWTIEADIRFGVTGAFFVWGTNPAQSDNSAFWKTIKQIAATDGMSLVCIDPRYTQEAALADLWIPVKPGTDCTLALGMMHVIIERGWQDQAFCDEWCHGFDELAAHVADYPPERVAAFCGIEAWQVIEAARIFAGVDASGELDDAETTRKGTVPNLVKRPTALISGRGIDQVGAAVAPTHRAICCLRAITGNVDRPGSCVLAEASDFVSEVEFEMSDRLTDAQRALCLNAGHAPLQTYEGYDLVRRQTEKLGRRLPMRYMTSVPQHYILQAMETGEPYTIRALIVNATNPLVTYADTNRVLRAFLGLDLIVVLDYYITPTASIADYVLPVAGAIERPIFQIHGGVANTGYGGPAAVEPYYERKTDYAIFRALGERLGQRDLGEQHEDAWPDETLTDAFASQLAPTGMTWDEYCRVGLYHTDPPYEKHLLPGPDGRPRGFATTTGKIELASELLPQLGGDRLPHQGELPHVCSPEFVAAAEAQGKHHIAMLTGSRKQPYNASMYLENPVFRKNVPGPVCEMNAATAASYGFAEGDVLLLETDRGSARFTLAIAEMRDGLLNVDYGWWHPEWGIPKAPEYGGIFESNVNCLTDCLPREPLIGTWAYNAVDCIVSKSDAAVSWDSI